MAAGYLVEIKPSARRINPAAGDVVNREGPRRGFEDKDAARGWAAEISEDGGAVRIQDAAPLDRSGVDGYLVADPHRRRREPVERPDLDTEPLDAF